MGIKDSTGYDDAAQRYPQLKMVDFEQLVKGQEIDPAFIKHLGSGYLRSPDHYSWSENDWHFSPKPEDDQYKKELEEMEKMDQWGSF